MRAALVALLATLVLALPSAALAGTTLPAGPALPHLQTVGDPTSLVLRTDADGNRTLLLNVEDSPVGQYTYVRVATPPAVPNAREVGAFTNAYAGPDGGVVLAAGVYARADAASGIVRVPLVLVENAGDSVAAVQATLLAATADALEQGGHAVPYASEILLPELADHFATPLGATDVDGFRDFPPLYVWSVHRDSPIGEAWVGHYLARTGHVEWDAAGNVAFAEKDAELGVAYRDIDGAHPVAGAFVTETVRASEDAAGRAQSVTWTAGAAAGAVGARVPLAGARLTDVRAGDAHATEPAFQRTDASVGVVVDGEFTPLAGVATEQSYRPSPNGFDVTRVTSAGVFVDGAYVPLAGARYHSDSGEALDVALRAALEGLGAESVGNFEVDVGAFPEGEYAPLAGAVYRSAFREARYASAAMIGVGPYTPVGFVPALVVTYDGSKPLTRWASAWLAGDSAGDEWMIAAGTMAAGSYVPVVGVQGIGRAPLGERAQQQEVRVGVFAASYNAFVPLASVAYDADETPANHAVAFVAGGGPGAEAGSFDARVGTYAAGDYVGVAGLQFRSEAFGERANETMLVAGVFVANGFVPLAGIVYSGDEPLGPSLGNFLSLRDDSPSRVVVGAFVLGEWTPLVEVQNNADDVRVTPLP